ncbi:MAG: helix-turn-helix domain-containing protein, partial [Burkholderiaceae bacterium]
TMQAAIPWYQRLNLDNDRECLAPLVKQVRNSLGMTQVAFADFMNVSHITIMNWEQGRTRPSYRYQKILEVAQMRLYSNGKLKFEQLELARWLHAQAIGQRELRALVADIQEVLGDTYAGQDADHAGAGS